MPEVGDTIKPDERPPTQAEIEALARKFKQHRIQPPIHFGGAQLTEFRAEKGIA